MTHLKNKTILITRPIDQSRALSESIAQHGGHCMMLPMLEIILHDKNFLLNQLAKKTATEIAIFTSANAAIALKNISLDFFKNVKILAIGAGTARALQQIGIQVDEIPLQQNSEGLLQLPILQQPAFKHILIFCGDHPRPYLKDQLLQQQATVDHIFCYRRQTITYSTEELQSALNQCDAIVSTSLEGLTHFIQSIPPSLLDILQKRNLIVISEPMVCFAKKFNLAVTIAEDASERAILQVLFNCLSSR